MKKLLLLIAIALFGFNLLWAQEEDAVRKEKMFKEVQEFKMKYLAQEMDLSELQKKKFFELYSEMSESKRNCYSEARVMDRRIKEDKEATEQDYQQVRNAYAHANAQWAVIEAQYDDKFSEFLSQKQIYEMKEAEASFRDKFEEMKHNRKKSHFKKKDDKK
ncbi:MAG: hypothetical protein J1F16_04730 [Muribaculaceae bacterium]|nr:hypothetical protein [Muribaculaceae bacterium]